VERALQPVALAMKRVDRANYVVPGRGGAHSRTLSPEFVTQTLNPKP